MTQYHKCLWCNRRVKLFHDPQRGDCLVVHRYSKRRVLCIPGSLKVIAPLRQIGANNGKQD